MATWMIYGANGYSGRLIAAEAVRHGQRPVLAGRSADSVRRVASSLNCPYRVLDLHAPARVEEALHDCRLVLNCAGPFAATAPALMQACLRTQTHYLDITGEIDCIEQAAALHRPAVEQDVLLLPAVGFDVVPTDCLAAILAEQLPSATQLQLGFRKQGPLSPGTARTMVQKLPEGGQARIDGRIRRVPLAWKMRQIDFGDGPQWAVTIPWGDVATAYYSTSIGNIEVYLAMPRRRIIWLRRMRWLLPITKTALFQRAAQRWIKWRIQGPSQQQRQQSQMALWGCVSDGDRTLEATMQTPGGYEVTMHTALAAVQRLLQSQPAAGFATPSQAFGKNFFEVIPGATLRMRQKDEG